MSMHNLDNNISWLFDRASLRAGRGPLGSIGFDTHMTSHLCSKSIHSFSSTHTVSSWQHLTPCSVWSQSSAPSMQPPLPFHMHLPFNLPPVPTAPVTTTGPLILKFPLSQPAANKSWYLVDHILTLALLGSHCCPLLVHPCMVDCQQHPTPRPFGLQGPNPGLL